MDVTRIIAIGCLVAVFGTGIVARHLFQKGNRLDRDIAKHMKAKDPEFWSAQSWGERTFAAGKILDEYLQNTGGGAAELQAMIEERRENRRRFLIAFGLFALMAATGFIWLMGKIRGLFAGIV